MLLLAYSVTDCFSFRKCTRGKSRRCSFVQRKSAVFTLACAPWVTQCKQEWVTHGTQLCKQESNRVFYSTFLVGYRERVAAQLCKQESTRGKSG